MSVTTQTLALATVPSATVIATIQRTGAEVQENVAEYLVAGVPTPVDATHGLPVNVVAGSAANAAAGATASAVPGSADYQGVNEGGTLKGCTGKTRGSEIAQSVQIVDASGNQVTTFGGTAGVVSGDHYVTATSTNARNIAAVAAKLRGLHIYNNAGYPIYVKYHNTAGVPTAGAAVVRTYACQAGQSRDIQIAGGGLSFGTGLGMTIVKGIADADATATVTNDAVVETEYE